MHGLGQTHGLVVPGGRPRSSPRSPRPPGRLQLGSPQRAGPCCRQGALQPGVRQGGRGDAAEARPCALGPEWEGRTVYANQMQMKAQKLLTGDYHFSDLGVRIGPLAAVLAE